MPESFRWYYAHDRVEDAEQVIKTISKVNHRSLPDMTDMMALVLADQGGNKKDRKYSALDLFRSKYLAKITILLSICW